MNKKDIALTVGGILATMVLAYLIYRLQQKDAAAAAAAQADASYQAQANQEELYQTLATPSTSTVYTPNINTNADLEVTGDPSSDNGSSTNNIVSGLLGDFSNVLNGTNVAAQNTSAASLIIPTLNETTPLGGNTSDAVPVTAGQALTQAASMLPGNQTVGTSSRNGLNTNVSPVVN